MITTLVTALIAGAASALMFASITSGALISLALFYLAPLPLMVAALGWGPLTSAIGGIAAGLSLGSLFGLPYFAAFVLSIALPSWWLGHLALLGRPAHPAITPTTPSVVDWYPVGVLLLWITGFAALTTLSALLTLGIDGDAITAAMRRGLMRMMSVRGTAATAELNQLVDALVTIAPGGAAIVATVTLTLNLFLAGKITATSGRLTRGWPDLTRAALPPMTLVGLCVALAFCFAGGLVGIIAQIIGSALLMAYALTGLATLHALTMGRKNRTVWLCCVYAVMTVFGWPVLGLLGLGLADAFLGLREPSPFRKPAGPPA